ncbi:MAG: hypothetical protein AAF745_04260 [Planctomycetota bacterium]
MNFRSRQQFESRRVGQFLCAGIFTVSAIISSASTFAGTVDLDFTADGKSRWYEWSSGVFAQLDQGRDGDPAIDGFFDVGDLDDSDGLTPAFGAVDVFPFESNFSNIGTLDFDGPDGGTGTFSVTGLNLNFQPFVADDDALLNGFGAGAYQTIVSDVTGTVSMTAGIVTSFDNVVGDVTFAYPVGPASLDFLGVDAIVLDGLTFDLGLRDAVAPSPASPIQDLEWDVFGTASGVSAIPEPAAPLLVTVASLISYGRRRKRH